MPFYVLAIPNFFYGDFKHSSKGGGDIRLKKSAIRLPPYQIFLFLAIGLEPSGAKIYQISYAAGWFSFSSRMYLLSDRQEELQPNKGYT